MRHVLALVSFHLVFENISALLPPNWWNHIDPEMMEKYQTPSLNSYSPNNFQGDITGISKDDFQQGPKSGLNNAINDQSKRWPNGIVPVQFSKVFTEDEDRRFELQTIHFAMQQITSSTSQCIRFINRTNEVDYILIQRGRGCTSDVGRQGGKQTISLDVGGCLKEIGSIQHELLHALGFYHEMSRKDRDEYIWINWDNIQEPYRKDFNIVTDGLDFGIKYDYESVLHYGPNAFAIDPLVPTIIPKQGVPHIGQSDGLSILDVIKLKKAYNCPGANDITFSQSRSLPNSQPDNGNMLETTMITTSTSTKRSIEDRPTPEILPPLKVLPIVWDQSKGQPQLTLADFKLVFLPQHKCETVSVGGCFLLSPNCPAGLFMTQCNSVSSSSNVKNHLQKMKSLISFSPLEIALLNVTEIRGDMFSPMTNNIIQLYLISYDKFDTGRLSGSKLPNLLHLQFARCAGVRVMKEGLSDFPILRQLSFVGSTIESIDVRALDSFSNLWSLAFESGVSPISPEFIVHLKRFHCSPNYSWLRNYLAHNRNLIETKQVGEIFNIAGQVNEHWGYRDLFYPVDCSRQDLTQQGDFFLLADFSINTQT